jgi:hypothetical protein
MGSVVPYQDALWPAPEEEVLVCDVICEYSILGFGRLAPTRKLVVVSPSKNLAMMGFMVKDWLEPLAIAGELTVTVLADVFTFVTKVP